MTESANSMDAQIAMSRLLRIRSLQSTGEGIYPEGFFPSQRYHPFLPYQRSDDNLFFTVSILHILNELFPLLSKQEKTIVDAIGSNARSSFKYFKNKDGLDTYNFWQTQPSRHFPNGSFIHRFDHFRIPDDVDDTTLVYLVEGASKARVKKLREKLKDHANLAYKKAFNPSAAYQELKCYSTFFGKRMYIEFDICVLSNLMQLILRHFKDDLNEYDHDTLSFIASVILSDEHRTTPFYAAPNYPTTPLILYHVTRLIPVLPTDLARKIRTKINADIFKLYPSTRGMERVIMESAAIRSGADVSSSTTDLSEPVVDDPNFFFFHAGMVTAFENRIAQRLAKCSLFHLRYHCKAMNLALLLENQVLKRSTIR